MKMPNSGRNIDELAGKAGKALGASPDEVKKAAQSGDISKILEKLTPSQAAQVRRVLSDEEAAKKLLSTSLAQSLLKGSQKNE